MKIGQLIETRRKQLGLTLEEVGNAVGVGKSTVRKWETGMISNMGRDKIAALSKILGIDPVSFVMESDENISPTAPDDLSPDERGLLSDYRELNDDGKRHVRETAETAVHMDKYKKGDMVHKVG